MFEVKVNYNNITYDPGSYDLDGVGILNKQTFFYHNSRRKYFSVTDTYTLVKV